MYFKVIMIYGCLKIQQLLVYRRFPFASSLAYSGFPFVFSLIKGCNQFGEPWYFVLCHQGFICIHNEKSTVSPPRYLRLIGAGM
jgi:hypothetical protein